MLLKISAQDGNNGCPRNKRNRSREWNFRYHLRLMILCFTNNCISAFNTTEDVLIIGGLLLHVLYLKCISYFSSLKPIVPPLPQSPCILDPSMNTEKSSEAVRRARKELFEKIRNDWDSVLERALCGVPDTYVPYQWRRHILEAENAKAKELADSTRHPFRKAKNEAATRVPDPIPGLVDSPDTAGGDALDWKERTYAPSDPSSDEEDHSSSNLVTGILDRIGVGRKDEGVPQDDAGGNNIDIQGDQPLEEQGGQLAGDNKQSSQDVEQEESDVSLDSEDLAIADSLSQDEGKKYLRARRRQKRLEKEMQWNDGLRYWQMRRDVWCGAKPRTLISQSQATFNDSRSGSHAASATATNESDKPTNGNFETNLSNQSSNTLADRASWSTPDHTSMNNDPQTPSTINNATTRINTNRIPAILLPVAPPLLPADDPTQGKISPVAYPTIYSKLVTQSLSPSVPLNLSAVVPALVEGWKETGDWPTGTPVDPTIATDPAKYAADKRSGTNGHILGSGLGVGAIADATKHGLRALGNRASRNSDPKLKKVGKGKASFAHGTFHRQDAPTQQPQISNAKSDPVQDKVSLEAPPERSPARAGSGTGTSTSTNEPSSPQRVRKSVAKVGKALKDGFIVSNGHGEDAPS